MTRKYSRQESKRRSRPNQDRAEKAKVKALDKLAKATRRK
jgi:hypothetical protein